MYIVLEVMSELISTSQNMLGSKYLQPLCACLLNTKQRLLGLASNKKRIQTSYHKASCKKFTYLNLCTFFLCHLTILFFRQLGKGFQKIQNYWNNKVKQERSHYFNVELNTAPIIAESRTNGDQSFKTVKPLLGSKLKQIWASTGVANSDCRLLLEFPQKPLRIRLQCFGIC